MKQLLQKTKSLNALFAIITLLLMPGIGWGQTQLAAWTFDAILAAPNTLTSVPANLGTQTGTAMLYADGTNGSSSWITATSGNELTAFAGTTNNDPRGGAAVAGMAYCPIGGTSNSSNGKGMVLKFSMTGYENPVLTFSTRQSGSTAYTNHQWAWSTDGSSFTNFGTNTAPTTTSFVTRTLDLSSINSLDGANIVYLRIIFSGATNSTSNNRLDNFVINATPTAATPNITVTPSTLTDFTYIQGSGPSTEQSFSVSGSNLTANISITPPTNYEISTGTGGSFVATNPITLTQSGGIIASTTIYVRLKAGLSAGSYNNENITATSTGATPKTVTCSGSVSAPPANVPPLITNITRTPSGSVSSSTSVSVSADVTDSDGTVEGVELHWGTASGSLTNTIAMSLSLGNTYTTNSSIPAQSGGTTVYYEVYALDDDADESTSNELNYVVLLDEPTNYPTSFSATSNSSSQVTVTWTDATGAQLPAAYLVKAAVSPANPAAPADGTPEADGALVKNIAHGTQSAVFTGLNAETTYNFSIWPFTNSESSINYKTDGEIPEAAATTTANISIYRSKATGNWNLASTWQIAQSEAGPWTDASVKPGAGNSVYIQSGHVVTLTQNEACNDLHISTGTTSATSGTDARVVLDSYTLEISGKLRSYFATIGTVPGTSSTTIPSTPITITASSTGKIRIVGSSRTITATDEWGAGNTGNTNTFAIEIALNAGHTATLGSGIKASRWDITTGILDAGGNRIAVDNGTEGQGDVTVASGAFLISSISGSGTNAIISRTGNSSTGEGGTFLLNGTLVLNGVAPEIAMTTLTLNGTVEYNGNSAQNLLKATVTGAANPTIYTNLTINNSAGVLLSTPLTTVTGTLLISSGKLLTIGVDKQLSVSGTLTNNAGNAGLVIKSDATSTGSLIHNTAVVGATVERYITAANWAAAGSGWHLLSSPVASQSISGAWTPTGTGNDYDFYAYDETANTNNWLNQKVGANNINTFIPGKGYLVAYQQNGTKTFNGNLNTANVTLSGLTNTSGSAYPGWHLVGNPFASAINWSAGDLTKTNITATAQVWNSASGSYQTTTEVSGIIPAMNGFMIYTTGNGQLTIPTNSRVHNAANWYKSDEEFILLKANDLEGQTSQSSIIRFNPASTEVYDVDFDSYFLAGFAPMFYSVSGSSLYALNTLPDISNDLVIPLGFVKNTATNFNIELAKNISGAIVYLTDKKTNKVTNLNNNPVYAFTASDGDDANRFFLHFASVGLGETPATQPVLAYYHDGALYVNNTEAGAEIMLFGISGQLLKQQTATAGLNTLQAGKLSAGVYVVRVQSAAGTYSSKVIVTR